MPAHIQKEDDLHFLHRGLYEGSHKLFKSLYAKSSKREGSCINEIVDLHDLDSGTDFTKIAFHRTGDSEKLSALYMDSEDSAMLARKGVQICLAQRDGLLPSLSSRRKQFDLVKKLRVASLKIYESIEKDC